MDRSSIPGLKNHILYQEAATPATLERYTANYHGASFGWAGTVDQLAIGDFKRPRFIKGLYLTGHWTTHGLGISGGVYVGHDTARMILKGKAKKSF
jgi:phytoene dehydrogenase-like protein